MTAKTVKDYLLKTIEDHQTAEKILYESCFDDSGFEMQVQKLKMSKIEVFV